eukprot:6653478-Prymnesium_polylepis.1
MLVITRFNMMILKQRAVRNRDVRPAQRAVRFLRRLGRPHVYERGLKALARVVQARDLAAAGAVLDAANAICCDLLHREPCLELCPEPREVREVEKNEYRKTEI